MRVLFFVGVLSLTGCVLDLDDYPRAFACDRTGGDGGQQCAQGWSCGFDNRCFRRNQPVGDGGLQGIETWQCEDDAQCPNDWRCGEAVDEQRHCQKVGVGFAWACATNAGCEADWRCDGFNKQCVLVTDELPTGQSLELGVRRINPRFVEAPPLRFAMTPLGLVPRQLFSAQTGLEPGVVMAALFPDGGLRVTAQLRESTAVYDAGVKMLAERVLPLPPGATPGDVAELAVATEGVALRLTDGRAFVMPFSDGGLGWADAWPDAGVTLLRQDDPRESGHPGTFAFAAGGVVRARGQEWAVPSTVHELMLLDGLAVAFTPAGGFELPVGSSTALQSPALVSAVLASPSRSVTASSVVNPAGDPFLTAVAEVPLDGGITGFTALTLIDEQMSPRWSVVASAPACPEGAWPLQLSMTEDNDRRPAVLARCTTPQGASYPVLTSVTGNRLKHEGVLEDAVPFLGPFVPQRAGALVRAHAGSDGRVWHALPPTPLTRSDAARGTWSMRAMMLDRQPTALVSFFERSFNAPRIFASTGADTFNGEVNGGLVSELREANVLPMGVVQGVADLLIAETGLIFTGGSEPRFVGLLPPGEVLQPPASGAAAVIELDGQRRHVVLVTSGDSVWTADVTDALEGAFSQPAFLSRVLVPVPGVRLRSLALDAQDGGISGYVTTNSQNLRFRTTDLERWALTAVPSPDQASLPLAVWAEADGAGRTGFSDGRVWSLPVMVELTEPLVARDGGGLRADDFARKCGDVFAASAEGVFRAEAATDGGLPRWAPLGELNASLDSLQSLRLFETHDLTDRLFVATKTGQVLEVTGTCR